MGENGDDKKNQAGQLFENFIQATTCKGTLQAFNILTRQLELDPQDHRHFYTKLKSKVTSWKAKALWSKLDKRNSPKEYKKGKACVATKCLIIGGGPCGLRTAIELSCLGAKVVVVEKRDTFSRNNVLHLWPYTIHDLRCLGAKKFYGKFCAGAIDHISIWQLQLMLFKIALLHGIEIHVNVEFVKLLTPPEDQENQKIGWRAEFLPQDHPLSEYEFDVIIGADGRRNTLEGFRRKEFRGKLAIAITANFINRNTTAEAKVEEISGVAFIFNQKFFQDLKEETGIDLENIVYYKDSTHYFVMTAKKQSLLDKGVIIDDYIDAEMLLCAENVNQDHLQSYAREAADFATNYQLPSLDFSINHYEQPDVAMFDFTSMYASENAALVRERYGHHLLVALVGDSLLEPFWPMGTGCARGFLAAFDTAWMVRSWAQGNPPLEIIAERESLYRLLPQTTPENISKNFDQYTIDPGTRYPNLNSSCVRPHQVKHLFITNELQSNPLERASSIRRSVGLSRRESDIRPNKLLTWCQKQTEGYSNVAVTNLTTSWKSGLALCAIIHHFRPDLIDFSSLNEEDTVRNNQLAFDIAEREFGISPITTGKEMASTREPDKLGMVLYLSKFYELFRGTPLRTVDTASKDNGENGDAYSSKPSNLLVNNYLNLTLPRKRVPKVEKKSEENDRNKRRREGLRCFEEPASFPSQSISAGNECSDTREVINQNKVKSMATQLLAKFEENAPNTSLRRQFQAVARPQQMVRPLPKPTPAPVTAARDPRPIVKADLNPSLSETKDPFTSAFPSAAALSGILERLQQLEEKVQQKRAKSLANREFHKKNIKEKAAHLASMFGCVDFPQNKLPVPSLGLSHFSSKIPSYATQVHDSSLPSSPPAIDPAPTATHSKKIIALNGTSEKTAEKQKLFFPDPGQMTVGKVSSGIGAVAEVIVNLYINDHRPKPKSVSPELQSLDETAASLFVEPSSPCSSISPLQKGSFRKEFPPNIGGSDICYFCKRRVYVVERLSAEGHFFHRECFKCAYCSTTLRLGNYVFNMAEGKFYCQPHFMYSFSNNKQRKRRTDSKIQEEDKMWKNEEPQLVGITTDSPDSASSSSEESSPDEPTSPKKSRSDLKPGGFQRRNSSASTDWKSVKIAPEEEMAEHNLLAVRVMVLSDGSSSDMEFDTPGDTPNSNGREVPGLSPPPIMHKEPIGDPPNNSDVKQEQKPAYSPTDALLRASSFQSVASNKPQRWRKSIQSTFPLFFGKKSVHLSRENSSSPVSSPDDEVFCSNVYSGHFETTHPLFNKSEQVLETTYVGIPSYVPHHEGLLNNSSLLTHTEPGTSRTRKPSANGQLSHYRGEMDRSREGHVDVHSPLPGYVSDCTEVFEDTTDDIRQDETLEQESKNGKNPTLKKLVLSKEEKSTLLDWNYAKPEIPVEKRGEQASSQVTHNPGKESESKSKSPFRILGVIKRSLTRSVSSVSENTTNISHFKAKPVPPSNHFDISSPFGNDIAFRRSQSSTGCPTRPDGKEMNLFISNHPTSSVTHNESLPHDFKAWDDGVPWKTGQDRPALSSEKPKRAYSSNTKIEDVMPKLLEKFTIKENHCSSPTHDLPFRNRKNSFFSSLRLKSKEPENGLSENAPRNDTWRVFGSIRKKGNETESSETSPKRAENVLHNPLPVQRSGPPCKPGRTAVSEQYSSSSDEECKPKRSTSLNATRTSKSRKKMKREAKQKAKQEELKRLHKAQQIQRQLQEVEEKQRALEIKGVKLEKALRGESDSATQDEAQLLYEWFQLALEKNKLNHYESELLFVAKGLDLEDQQGRLEQKLRDRMLVESSLKGETDIQEEGEIFAEMMRVIEQRDQLVSYIEEQRLRENTQDKNSIQLPKDCQLKMDIFNNKIMI
ncbi:F-actin-monooxygenase MICAL2 isoform X5 [Ascaphus truei]|uniref:F-actin-monooxygenase MICAL2 isoform X5 n=1 Tax=Ascaphus truei TaxID=8439 RepID=UPI003F5A6158